MNTDTIKSLFKDYYGVEAASCAMLAASGGDRRYFRLKAADGRTAIGTLGTVQAENRAFLAIARHFAVKGLNVPQILAVSPDTMDYLQSDLGDDSLFAALTNGRKTGSYSAGERELLLKTVSYLPRLQFEGAEGLDFGVCYPLNEFDRRSILFDLNYFKYDYLKLTGFAFDEIALQDDLELLADDLLESGCPKGFMYRDFQARNVMVKDGNPWFIDFQGGRRGPIEYDLASFLWQARAAYPDRLKQHLIDVYLEALAPFRKVSEKEFRASLHNIVLFRTLQVLGAYGFRGYFERKPHFVQSIPAAIDNLRDLLKQDIQGCPYLTQLLRDITKLPQFNPQPAPENVKLTVRVMSFSYRKGLPHDDSGNGGGFIFDCRGMHNPGKYDCYKKITGADAPVIEFLEERGEVQKFLEHAYGMVDPSVDRYIERGFANLMVSFGCTGGQHRSLYCANHMAEHLKQKYGDRINVLLEHREQGTCKEL